MPLVKIPGPGAVWSLHVLSDWVLSRYPPTHTCHRPMHVICYGNWKLLIVHKFECGWLLPCDELVTYLRLKLSAGEMVTESGWMDGCIDGWMDGYSLVQRDGRWLNVFWISSHGVRCKNPPLEPKPEASPVGRDQGEMLAGRAPRQCGCFAGEQEQRGHLSDRLISVIERHNPHHPAPSPPPHPLSHLLDVGDKNLVVLGITETLVHRRDKMCACVCTCVCACVCVEPESRIIWASRLQDCAAADREEVFTFSFFSRFIRREREREMLVSQNTMTHFITTFCKVHTSVYCQSWIHLSKVSASECPGTIVHQKSVNLETLTQEIEL